MWVAHMAASIKDNIGFVGKYDSRYPLDGWLSISLMISPATAAFGKVRIWAPVLVRWFGLRKFVRPTPSVAL